MAKKRHEPIRGLSEREATKEYFHTLKDIYREEGLLAVAGYEIKSTLYSLGKRIANLFEEKSSAEHVLDFHNEAYYMSGAKPHYAPSETVRILASYEIKNREARKAQRKA